MTQSQATVSLNDQLWIIRTTGTVTRTQILGVETVGMPERTPEDVDVTHQQSPDRTRETIPGMMSAADYSQELQYWPDHASQTLLETLAGLTEAGTPELVQVAMVIGGTQRTYKAHVLSFTPTGTVGDKRMAALNFKIFGRVTPNPSLTGGGA